jgi:hypothetical protein
MGSLEGNVDLVMIDLRLSINQVNLKNFRDSPIKENNPSLLIREIDSHHRKRISLRILLFIILFDLLLIINLCLRCRRSN